MSPRRVLFWLVALALLMIPLAGPARRKSEKPETFFVEEGNRVTWEGWTFSWSIHPRNGLVIENVAFRGKSVLKYAGLAEIFVPYNRGEPRPEDFGGGIGDKLVELYPGRDCIPGALNCMSFNRQGKAEGKRVAMLHEESLGLSYIGNLGRAYGKMLVLWNTYNLGGYYYIQRWRFRDDGCLMPEIGLTGPLQHIGKGDASQFGSLVGKNKVFAQSHVHNIYYCLDFDIDGADNNVVEEFNYEQDKPGSVSGKHSWTPIKKESMRSTSAANFRSWRVVNPASKNILGLPRSYELVPTGGIYRGGANEQFAHGDLWVIRQNPKEHPNTTRPLSEVLPGYLNDESVDGQNVVLYYALHLHHIPRTEDWPGMPVDWHGFMLKPRDFLDSSPVQPK